MPRIRLFFKGLKDFNFPKNYDDHLSFLFVKLIKEYLKETPFENFNFFTFSDFVIEKVESYEKFLVSTDGILSVVVSSCDESFLRYVVSIFVEKDELYFEYNKLSLFKFVFLDEVNFDYGEAGFISVSPIFLKNYKGNDGLFSYLENQLIKRYSKYNKLNYCNLSCEITTMGDVFQEVVDNNNESGHSFYYYILDLYIVGDPQLISFAYDNGLGDNTNKGFGMIDLY